MKTETPTFLRSKPITEWIAEAAAKPVPQPLCGDLWHQGELALMFSDEGLGKSILAMQIADDIVDGTDLGTEDHQIFRVKCDPQPVVYVDLEMTDKQLEMRYSYETDDGSVEHFEFCDELHRAVLDPTAVPPTGRSLSECLVADMERLLDETGSSVLIVDNIMDLRMANDSTREAVELMRELRRLNDRRNISILALAHSPRRIARRPINLCDLPGSRLLGNLADSIFAIGESCLGPDIRYIKQLKSRGRQIVFDRMRTAGCVLSQDGADQYFDHAGYSPELNHLRDFDAAYRIRIERTREIASLGAAGLSQREIAAKLGISAATVNRYLNDFPTYPDPDGDHFESLMASYGYQKRREFQEKEDRADAEQETAETAGSADAVQAAEMALAGKNGHLRADEPDFTSDDHLRDMSLRE